MQFRVIGSGLSSAPARIALAMAAAFLAMMGAFVAVRPDMFMDMVHMAMGMP